MEPGYDIVIHSMGSAGAGLLRSLRPVSRLSDRELARRLLQAPSVVLENLDRDTAEKVSRVLSGTGARVSYRAHDEDFEPGTGEFEIAATLVSHRYSDSAVQALMGLMNLPVKQASMLLARTPAILINQVSAATVEVFREQLEPAGVELDVSRPDTALYDLYATSTDSASLQRARKLLDERGIAVNPDPHNPVLATDVDHRTCQALWKDYERSAAPLVILNQDYQRADIRLLSARPGPGLDRYLGETLQLPDRAIERLYDNLPLVVARCVPRARVDDILSRLESLGARAEGHITAFQQFGLKVPTGTKASHIAPVLGLITNEDATQCQRALQKQPGWLPGPYNSQQARWLQAELRKANINARLVPAGSERAGRNESPGGTR